MKMNLTAATEEVALTKSEPTATLQGDWNISDINIPRVNLVQKMSPTSEDFKLGTFLFDREPRPKDESHVRGLQAGDVLI
jgi:hypothetical protein